MPKKNQRPIDRAIELAGTPGALAERLHVSPQVVTNWRSRGMPADKILLAAATFNVPVEYLLTGKRTFQGPPWPLPSVPPEWWAALPEIDRARVDAYALGRAEKAREQLGGLPDSHGSGQHRAAS